MKGKSKWFIIGIICGVFVASGVGYATDRFQLEVKLPNIPYVYDGQEILTSDQSLKAVEEQLPQTINYNNVNYVSARALAEAMGKEVSWDSEEGKVVIRSAESLPFESIDLEETTSDIESWVSLSLDKQTTKKRTFAGKTHILITLGEKNSGGYDIQVRNVKQYYDKIVVNYDIITPDKGIPVIDVFTYPYEIIALPDEYYLPVHFVQNN